MADNALAPQSKNRLAAALSYEQDRPAFGNPSMLEQGRKMRERKQAEQVERSAQNVKSDLLARALMRRYNPETLTGLTDTPEPQTLDEAAGLDPRVDRSTLLPYSQKEGWHVPAAVAGLMKLATASNPQYSHLMQPEEAMPLATNMMGGGMGASRAAPAPAGSLGMFIGKNAKTWDASAAAKAVQLEKAGADAATIWQQTGTWKAPDGMWRQEIPDASAGFRMEFNSALPSKSNAYSPMKDIPIGGAFNHPELYAAYPDILRTGRMEVAKSPDWMPASSNSGSQRGNQFTVRNKTEEGARSTILHELQHAIQQREGFARGGNESQFYAEVLKDIKTKHPLASSADIANIASIEAFRRYRALIGEVEARATEARANLTAAERRNVLPEKSYDLPLQLLRAK